MERPKEQIIEDDKDRWLYFFKEGQNLELDNLPENLKTKEIVKAIKTLNHFSNDQKAYLLYQDRLESTRVASTLCGVAGCGGVLFLLYKGRDKRLYMYL